MWSARHAKSIDGAEHGETIEPLMAGQAVASGALPSQSCQSCAIAITIGEDVQPEGILTVDLRAPRTLRDESEFVADVWYQE